jgi:hypothetical protein
MIAKLSSFSGDAWFGNREAGGGLTKGHLLASRLFRTLVGRGAGNKGDVSIGTFRSYMLWERGWGVIRRGFPSASYLGWVLDFKAPSHFQKYSHNIGYQQVTHEYPRTFSNPNP